MNGTKLKDLRRRKGMTQREVAESAGLTKETVDALENGRTSNPTYATLRKLAECYGVGIADLLDE